MSSLERLPEIPEENVPESVEHFRNECFNHKICNSLFYEKTFEEFIQHVRSDSVLLWYFYAAHLFHIYENEFPLLFAPYMKELLKPESHKEFINKMNECRERYRPYTIALRDLFHAASVTCSNFLTGDFRDPLEIFQESIPQRHIILGDRSVCYFEVRRTHPIGSAVVAKRTRFDTEDGVKKIYEAHIFGIGSHAESRWRNADLKIMCDHFSEDRKALPSDRLQTEYLWYYHSESLPPAISWAQLDKVCGKASGVALAWGPRFINLIRKEVSCARERLSLKAEYKNPGDASTYPSLYGPKYWILMEYPDEIENIVCYHFLGAINKLDQCRSDAAIPTWIETVLKRAVAKELKRELKKAKKREEPSFFEGLHYEIDKNGEIPREERFAGEPPLSVAPFDFDSLFPNPRENYIAKNFSRKGVVKDAAQRFGLTERRIQQIKKKVGERLDRDEDERSTQAHLCVWFPGLDDDNIVRGELRRIASLLYKKPQLQWPHKFTKGRVKRKAQDRTSQETPRLRKKS